jgi:hypothetical protein
MHSVDGMHEVAFINSNEYSQHVLTSLNDLQKYDSKSLTLTTNYWVKLYSISISWPKQN